MGKMNPFWRSYFSKGLVQPPPTGWDFACFTALGASKSNQLVEVVALAPAEPMEDLARFKLPMLPPGAPVELGWLVERWVLFFWKLGKIIGKSDRSCCHVWDRILKLAMYCELLLFGEQEAGIQLIGTMGSEENACFWPPKTQCHPKPADGTLFGALGFMRNTRIYMGSSRA